MKKYLTEFIGTFFLVLTIGCVVAQSQPGTTPPPVLGALAIGSMLMVMVYMGGHISGAQYNPAVSLAVLVAGKQGFLQFIGFVIVQFLAAAVATLTSDYLHPSVPVLVIKPPDGAEFKLGLLAEALFTFALAIVVLNVACAKKTQGNSFYGLAIGLTVFAGAIVVGPISGAAFNPAVGLGPNLLNGNLVQNAMGGSYETLLLYGAAPLAGGLVAGLVFHAQEAGA